MASTITHAFVNAKGDSADSSIVRPTDWNANHTITTTADAWTPTITFATPGDLAVTYSVQVGRYILIGSMYTVWFNLTTSAFTFTTASGIFQITGLPATASNAINFIGGAADFGGWTKVGYTQIAPSITGNTAIIQIIAAGSGLVRSFVSAADVPTGSTIVLRGSVSYYT